MNTHTQIHAHLLVLVGEEHEYASHSYVFERCTRAEAEKKACAAHLYYTGNKANMDKIFTSNSPIEPADRTTGLSHKVLSI